MHLSSLLRMDWFFENYLGNSTQKLSILDVGSGNVNGSYKSILNLDKFSYTGLDVEEGPGVDIVPQNPYSWKEIEDDSFDAVISGQVLEHAEFFWITMAEMARVLKKGGLLCIIVPRGFARHRYPVDCYRFDTDGMIALARYCNLKVLHASTDLSPAGIEEWHVPGGEDSMLVARKPLNWQGIVDISTYRFEPFDIEKVNSGFVPKK